MKKKMSKFTQIIPINEGFFQPKIKNIKRLQHYTKCVTLNGTNFAFHIFFEFNKHGVLVKNNLIPCRIELAILQYFNEKKLKTTK